MGWFKRLCLFVFGLSGLLSLAVLSLSWVGPWTATVRSWILEPTWYFMALEVLVCIAVLGALACVLAALFAPRNPRETVVAKVDGGQITVTRAAIVSQTKHIIEEDGSCIASSVRVKVRKRGHVRVFARVKPRYPVDVVAQGEKLYAALHEGLARVCGDSVKSISVVFTEPDRQDMSFVQVDDGTSDEQPAQATQAESITVPMSSVAQATDYSEPEPSEETFALVDASDAEAPSEDPAQAETLTLDVPEEAASSDDTPEEV